MGTLPFWWWWCFSDRQKLIFRLYEDVEQKINDMYLWWWRVLELSVRLSFILRVESRLVFLIFRAFV